MVNLGRISSVRIFCIGFHSIRSQTGWWLAPQRKGHWSGHRPRNFCFSPPSCRGLHLWGWLTQHRQSPSQRWPSWNVPLGTRLSPIVWQESNNHQSPCGNKGQAPWRGLTEPPLHAQLIERWFWERERSWNCFLHTSPWCLQSLSKDDVSRSLSWRWHQYSGHHCLCIYNT